jgi:carboxylesterase type B
MNIATPSAKSKELLPVMVYIHGGSLVYGGANEPIFDGVNAVTYSMERKTPVVTVNLNYRVGYGGFLASEDIKADLTRDGHAGVGNFGITDQQVCLDWVQKYIANFNGDKNNVTIYGLSAGGMSVSYHLWARNPSIFHRAALMSGSLNTVEHWPLERHEKRYQDLLQYLGIEAGPSALEKLRALPDAVVAAATLPVEGTFVCTMNPCDDGDFFEEAPSFTNIKSPPSWLQSFMVSDTSDEAIILRNQIQDLTVSFIQKKMSAFMTSEEATKILEIYGMPSDVSEADVPKLFEDMASDTHFIVQNWLHLHASRIPQSYGYHFDQLSTLDNVLKGTAYHAIDLLYVFLNLKEEMTPEQIKLADKVAGDYIDFAYGKDPFERFSVANRWMVYGPDDKWEMKTEQEDEPKRRYSRMQAVIDMGLLKQWCVATDDIGIRRYAIGTINLK